MSVFPITLYCFCKMLSDQHKNSVFLSPQAIIFRVNLDATHFQSAVHPVSFVFKNLCRNLSFSYHVYAYQSDPRRPYSLIEL